MLNLHKLEIFARVVTSGSFSAAAGQLFMSQPAVSKHIQDLESGLGVQLFERAGSRGVRPTPAGQELYQYTQQILALVAEAENKITRVENITDGQIAVGVTQGVGSYRFPAWLGRFSATYPHLTVSLQTGITSDIVANVLNHKLQIGFIEGELDSQSMPHLATHMLQTIEMLVVVGPGHPWWGRETIAGGHLHQQAYVARQPGSHTRRWTDGIFTRNGIQPRIVAELDSTESIKSSVASGLGVAILPDYTLQQETKLGLLNAMHIEDIQLERELKVIWPKQDNLGPISRAFLRLLAQDYPTLKTIV